MSMSARIAAARRRSGSVAILAAAVMVLAGFIGVALVATLRVTASSVATDAQATQAYYIADAGSEWACKHGTPTAAPVSFAGGTFEVTQNGEEFEVVASAGQAQCTIHADESPDYPVNPSTGDGGIEYVLRSRVGGWWISTVDCIVMNTSSDNITFNALKVTWGSPTAYFESVTFRVANGTNYGTLWYYTDPHDDDRWASGEKHTFTRQSSVTLPAHYSAELHFLDFVQRRSGSSGWPIIMSSAVVAVEFYMDSTLVGSITIDQAPT